MVVPDDVADDELDPVVAWRLQRSSGVYADVIPCRASDFAEDRGTPNTLAFEAATTGVLVHERGSGRCTVAGVVGQPKRHLPLRAADKVGRAL